MVIRIKWVALEVKNMVALAFNKHQVICRMHSLQVKKEKMMLMMMRNAALHSQHLEKRISFMENLIFIKENIGKWNMNSICIFCISRRAIIFIYNTFKKTILEFIWMECSPLVFCQDNNSHSTNFPKIKQIL